MVVYVWAINGQQMKQQEQNNLIEAQNRIYIKTQLTTEIPKEISLLNQQLQKIKTQSEVDELKNKIAILRKKMDDLQLQDGEQLQIFNNLKKQLDQIQTSADDPSFTIKFRQNTFVTDFITSDSTLTTVTASKSYYDTIKGKELTVHTPWFDTYKSNIPSSSLETQQLIAYKNGIYVRPTFSGQSVDEDQKSLVPLQIVPFPSINQIKENSFTISKPFYNDNDTFKEYNFKGDYNITSSSNLTDAYKAFTNTGTWKSDNTYKVTDYTSSYYIGNKVTTVDQQINPQKTYGNTIMKGEWLQISLPRDKPLYLFRYSICVPNTGSVSAVYPTSRDPNNNTYIYPTPLPPNRKYTSSFPKSFTVVGSNDGIKWFFIDQQTYVEPPDIDLIKNNADRASLNNMKGVNIDNNTFNFELNTVNRYTFYRLIITELFPGNSNASITTWGLYGFVQNISPNIKTLESFSTQYVTGMSSGFGKRSDALLPDKFGDDFSKDIDSKLKRTYIEQLTNLNKAKNIPDPLSNLASYSVVENFDSHGFVQYSGGSTNSNAVIKNQINPTISIYNDFLSKQTQINRNVYDLSQNIYDFSNNYFKALKDPNDKYDMSGNNFNKPPTQLDGLISDSKEIIMQQNNIFILSTITITTLVLALILVSK